MRKMKRIQLLIPLFLMPVFLFLSMILLEEKYYAACSALFAFLTCVTVMKSFDRNSTNLRKMVLMGVMTTLSVMSRFFFAIIPGFKPMTAIIVLTAMYLGPEAGFFCGAFTALISNLYFGQGPWTPFQMLSFGLLGLLAGVFGTPLRRNKVLLVLYGIFSGIAFSFIMDIWTVLWYNSGFQLNLYLTAMVTALPYTISYALSNVIFLLVLYRPFSRKLERVVYKIGT